MSYRIFIIYQRKPKYLELSNTALFVCSQLNNGTLYHAQLETEETKILAVGEKVGRAQIYYLEQIPQQKYRYRYR